ncbi:hypothetical protein H8356DRAFT_1652705 [Neocallimastix lanati (nom. inval.)]|nr:hypothetical protein H8356DRAFT_1652705 [Neocallimastix sp. JGI-2020a]
MIEKFSLMLEDKEKSLNQTQRELRTKDRKINELTRELESLQKEKNREMEKLKSTIHQLTAEKDNYLRRVNYLQQQHQTELESVKQDLRREQLHQREANTTISNDIPMNTRTATTVATTPSSISSNSSGSSYERRSGRISASSPSHNNAQIMERISKMRSEVDAMRKKLRNKTNNEFSI